MISLNGIIRCDATMFSTIAAGDHRDTRILTRSGNVIGEMGEQLNGSGSGSGQGEKGEILGK